MIYPFDEYPLCEYYIVKLKGFERAEIKMRRIFSPWYDKERKRAEQIPLFFNFKIGEEFGFLKYSGDI